VGLTGTGQRRRKNQFETSCGGDRVIG